MSQDETPESDTVVSVYCDQQMVSAGSAVSVSIGTPRSKEHNDRIKVFLTELTALTHKHGFYLESETEHDYSGGSYGRITIEEVGKYRKAYSYGYDNDLTFTNWDDGWWGKQVEWNKTIVGDRSDTV